MIRTLRTSATLLVVAAALAACASTQKPGSLSQAEQIYTRLSTSGAQQRVEGDLIKAQQAIGTAQTAVGQHQNQDYVNGVSSIALRTAQTAEANDARVMAKAQTDSLHDARLRRLLLLTEAQRSVLAQQQQLSQEEIAVLRQRNMLAGQQADSLRQQNATVSQQADSLRRVAEQANAALNTALTQLRSLVVEITNLRETSRGLVISLSDILFDVDKATLKPGADQNVRRIAAILKQYPDKQISVEGHTDNTGTDAHNQALSESRAASVRMALVSGGVDPSTITSKGLGESQPVATNATAAGRQQNRRVEIVVLGAGTVYDATHVDSTSTTTTTPPTTTPPTTTPPR
jgi:outer membrane protein OmpA-like peptidoglycan-associated protein